MDISAEDLRKLKSYVRGKLHNKEDAEDVVQQTCMKALIKQNTYRGECQLSSWLCAIAHNTMVKRFKHDDTVLGRALIGGIEFDDIAADDGCNPAAIIEAEQDERQAASNAARLPAALAMINENFRRTIELVFLGGLTYPQAAEEMHVPIGTIRSRVNRGCAALRIVYGNQA